MKASKNTKTMKHTSYQEIDDAIWLYNFVSGAKLKKMCDIPSEPKQYREDFINNTIKFYEENS